ncbi:Histidine kinase [bacterium A37T11]|nr:Histidine kinase [bacterium A37T11]
MLIFPNFVCLLKMDVLTKDHDLNTNLVVFLALLLIMAIVIVVLLLQVLKLKKEKSELTNAPPREHVINTAMEAVLFKNKLNPHLLRNALNAIQSHAYQSYYALDKLSSVLDYILYESDGQFVSLKDELEFALNLIEINRLKTSPLFDLHVKNKVDLTNPAFSHARIAPFISINPIENAFKHADLQSEGAFISVSFELKDGWFLLSVSNKISSKPFQRNGKGGLGNKAFQNRLDMIYPRNYDLKETSDGEIFHTLLKIKLVSDDA